MIKLRARPDYYRIGLNVHFGGDSEILNSEYKREERHTSEDKFSSGGVEELNNDEESEQGLVLILTKWET